MSELSSLQIAVVVLYAFFYSMMKSNLNELLCRGEFKVGITVRDAMQIGGLVHCKVVAGEAGLDRTIDSITVMEVPDIVRWLQGNVMLLSSLYPIKDDEEAIGKLVQRLEAAGSSALAIKTEQYIIHIPEIIIQEGNRLHLPIIEIKNEVTYLDIMTPLMERILNERDTGKERLESFYQWMTELAMRGKGLSALIEALEHLTDNKVTVGSDIPSLDMNKGMDIVPLDHARKYDLKIAKRPIRMNRLLDGTVTPCIVTPIMLNDEFLGDVTCWFSHREPLEQDFYVFDRSMPLFALEFSKIITKADVEQTFKDHVLADVLLGRVQDREDTIERGKRFGWDLTKNYEVLCILASDRALENQSNGEQTQWSPERKIKLVQQVNSLFRFDNFKVIVTVLKGMIIVLIPREKGDSQPHPHRNGLYEKSTRDTAQTVRQHLINNFDDLVFTVGIGRFHEGLDGIRKGYAEALQAIKLGKPIGRSGYVHYDDLGIFRLLGQFHDRKELENLYSETLGKLAEYDSVHQGNLLITLQQYFTKNCSLSETAEALYIHVNTMKYRLHKIEQLTGLTVHDAEDRLLLHIGLKISQLMQFEA